MIELGDMLAKDFGCFKEVTLSFTRQGLMLVQGDNRDTDAADSNGSGKSTLFKALSWVLFGRTVDQLKGDDVIRLGTKTAEVTLNFTTDNKAYTVVRTKSRGKSEILKVCYTKGRKSLGARTLKDTQSLLEDILSLDWLAFRNTVLYGQGDILHFADPRTTDTQRKAVITKILRLERIEDARANARKRKSLAVAKQGRLDGEITIIKAQLETLGTADLEEASRRWTTQRNLRIQGARSDVETAEAELESVAQAQQEAAKLQQRLDEVQAILAEYKEQDAGRKPLLAQDIDLQGWLARLLASLNADHRVRDETVEAITTLKTGGCPTCGTPSVGKHVKRMLEKLQDKAAHIEIAIRKAETDIEKAQSERRDVQAELDGIAEALADQSDWVDAETSIIGRIRDCETIIGREAAMAKSVGRLTAELERLKGEDNPYSTQIQERQEQSKKLRTQIVEKQTETALIGTEINVCDFWVEGFGPSGLPSYLMDSVVPVVAARANKYLEILSDGDLRVKLDTLTQLKGGGVRDKLELSAVVEGQEGVPMSGGQLKKVTLACDLALMDLLANREGASVDLLLLDEVLDGLDASGRARVMDLLEHLRSQRATIIVISHDPEIVEKFGKTINIVKKGGIARLAA